eukprot:g110.t1
MGETASTTASSAPPAKTLAGTITAFLQANPRATDDDWVAAARTWSADFGADAVTSWSDPADQKFQHRLVHLAVAKTLPKLLQYLVEELECDVNVQREHDRLTPMHIALWYKKRSAELEKNRGRCVDILKEAESIDLTIQNKYGEDCSAKYEELVASYGNLIFLDLEMSCGFYDWANRVESEANTPPRILEIAVVITDKDLNEKGRGTWPVGGFSKQYLEKLGDFHQKNFRDRVNEDGTPTACAKSLFPPLKKKRTAAPDATGGAANDGEVAETVAEVEPKQEYFRGNGLFSDMMDPDLAKPLQTVESEVLALLKQHCPPNACPLAGASVGCDRELLKTEMPQVYAYLSHRVVDTSTVIAGMMDPWCDPALDLRDDWKKHQTEHGGNYNHRALNDCESAILTMKWLRKTFFDPVNERGLAKSMNETS